MATNEQLYREALEEIIAAAKLAEQRANEGLYRSGVADGWMHALDIARIALEQATSTTDP